MTPALWLLPFAGAAVASLWAAPELGEAARRMLYLGWFLLLFWLVPWCIRSEVALGRVLRAIVAASALAAVLGLAQFALQFVVGALPLLAFWIQFITPILEGERVAASYQTYGTNWILWVGGTPLMRAIGTFSGPPDVAQFLGVSLPLTTALLLHRDRVSARDRAGLVLVYLFLALTFSRQAWVGMVIALPVMYLHAGPSAALRRRLGYLIAAGGLLLIAALAAGSVQRGGAAPLVERLLSIGDRSDVSNLNRFQTWSYALVLAERHPVLGAGLGNYAAAAGERHGTYSHSTYLDMLVETGPLGLLGLLGLLAWAWSSAYWVAQRGGTAMLRAAGCGALGSVVALAVIFFFDDAFFFPRAGQACWLLLGLIAATRRLAAASGTKA